MEYSNHAEFMQIAIDQARLSLKKGCGPVGCIVVKNGEVIASGHNEEALRCDPTAHAEIVVIQKACQVVSSKYLDGCVLYSTLQLCAMCTVACIWARVECIVYGARREDVPARYFSEKSISVNELVHDSTQPFIELVPGILVDECAALYKNK